jgi:glycosyltransferase involved in cell wall biosynthesis
MRVGHNPLRHARADELKPVVLVVVTHLPHFEGYHAKRLEVVQTCLESMTRHAGMEHSVIIWDNGSCDEFREWVQEAIEPDVFIQSINIGKNTARTAMTRILPPKTIICYSDDDMYFYPDWLRPQIKLLKHFPNVASVTGYPVRTSFRWGNEHTKAWATQEREAKLEHGRWLPQEWEDDFAVSIGRDVMTHRDTSANDYEARITYRGVQAYATSHHCQFVGYAGIVGRVVTWDAAAMADERGFDMTLDELGLRLATTERLTRHIGNVLHDELREEITRSERVKE